jgi:hypothetical protein
MPVLSYLHQLFHAEACDVYIHSCGGKIARSNVPVVTVKMSAPGAHCVRPSTSPSYCVCTSNSCTNHRCPSPSTRHARLNQSSLPQAVFDV